MLTCGSDFVVRISVTCRPLGIPPSVVDLLAFRLRGIDGRDGMDWPCASYVDLLTLCSWNDKVNYHHKDKTT